MTAMPDRSVASGAARNRGAASAKGSRRADAGNCGRAWGMEGRRPMKPADAPQARRSGRADAGNCGAVKRTKTAAAETAAAGRGAGQWMNAGRAKAV